MSAAPVVEQLSREMGISTATALFDRIAPHPVDPVLSPLFRHGGLPRGELVTVTGELSLSCALATTAAATREQKWCAGIGLGEPAVSSIADLGVDLDHFVNLATPGEDWLRVVSILIESFDIILVDPGFAPSASERARLLAKVRERRMSLISLRPLSGSTEQIEITDTQWSGADRGRGRLQSCLVRARSQTGIHRFLLPGPSGTPAAAPALTGVPAGTQAAPAPAPEPAASAEPTNTGPKNAESTKTESVEDDPRWKTITHLRQVISHAG
ncbi:porin [Brevibacterium spongiae]|uniref:Porin n=1 Tax=Brevibacterium spongiae TaxID=2909672 RepID=A0ABY5SIN9_9MICO|nr:porin [Brevibacterium spongiae]UVI34418.1 porin [Brevibacterium spongiae]